MYLNTTPCGRPPSLEENKMLRMHLIGPFHLTRLVAKALLEYDNDNKSPLLYDSYQYDDDDEEKRKNVQGMVDFLAIQALKRHRNQIDHSPDGSKTNFNIYVSMSTHAEFLQQKEKGNENGWQHLVWVTGRTVDDAMFSLDRQKPDNHLQAIQQQIRGSVDRLDILYQRISILVVMMNNGTLLGMEQSPLERMSTDANTMHNAIPIFHHCTHLLTCNSTLKQTSHEQRDRDVSSTTNTFSIPQHAAQILWNRCLRSKYCQASAGGGNGSIGGSMMISPLAIVDLS